MIFWQKWTDKFLAKTVLKLVPGSVTPNQVTWFRIFSLPLVFWLFYTESYFWGLIIFSLSAFTDALDGAMARTRDQVTEFGKFLDPIADRGLLFLAALIFIPRFFGWPLFVALAVLEIFHTLMALTVLKKLGYHPGSNWAGVIKMILQSIAFIMVLIGLVVSVQAWIYYAGVLLYVSLPFVFLTSFLYKA